jgi:hypothetical protein
MIKGDLPRHSAGTVLYTMENLGRLLIMVNWDMGFVVPVFPGEIELQRTSSELLSREAQSSIAM